MNTWRKLKGRKLNAYIAEKLGINADKPLSYSTSTDVALTLVKNMVIVSIHYGAVSTVTGQLYQVDLHDQGGHLTECGDALPLTICYAWLAWSEARS